MQLPIFIDREAFNRAFEEKEKNGGVAAMIDRRYFYIPPEDTIPIEGFELPQDFPKGDSYLEDVFIQTEKRYKSFPNCCEEHKKLLAVNWCKIEDYKNIATKVIKQLAYTFYHINKRINLPDWYKDITHYFQYNLESFGQFPTEYGNRIGIDCYTTFLKHWIKNVVITENEFDFSNDKRDRLIAYIDGYLAPENELNNNFDLLLKTYSKWLQTFPFETSYFSQLKDYFVKHIPIMDGAPEHNKYTGTTGFKLQTQYALIEVLNNTTKDLLSKIVPKELIKQGLISDMNKHRVDLANESLKISTAKLLNDYSKNELKYVKILNKWLKFHSDYFSEVAPLILKTKQIVEDKHNVPRTFNELFYNESYIEPCINILRELTPPFIDAKGNYIGKNKGIFPLWIKVLKSHKPEPIIKHCQDIDYKNLLNKKFTGLNLSKDASEFRKDYIRLVDNNIELHIKTLLSQISQSGKLGKLG